MQRRSFIKAAGTSIGLTGTSRVVGASRDSVEVVMEWKGTDPYVTKIVPKQWLRHTELVKAIAKQLNQEYADNPGVIDFEVVAGGLNVGGKNGNKIQAVVQKDDPVIEKYRLKNRVFQLEEGKSKELTQCY